MVGYRRVVALSVSIIGALAEDDASTWDYEQVAYGPGLPYINAIAKYVSRFHSIVGGAHQIDAANKLDQFADGVGGLHACSNDELLKGDAIGSAAELDCILIQDSKVGNIKVLVGDADPFKLLHRNIGAADSLIKKSDFIHGSEKYHLIEPKSVIKDIYTFFESSVLDIPEVPLNVFYQSEDVLSHNGILKITSSAPGFITYTWFPEFDPKKVIELYNHTMPCAKATVCGTEASGIFKVVTAASKVDSFGAAMVYYTTVLTITNAAVNGITKPAAIACKTGLPAVGKIRDIDGALLADCTGADFCAEVKENKHTLTAGCGTDHGLTDIDTARKFNDDHRYGLMVDTDQTGVFSLFKLDQWAMLADVKTSTQKITYKKFTENSKWDLTIEIPATAAGSYEPAFKIVPGVKSDIVIPQEGSLKDSFRYLFENNSLNMGDGTQAVELVDSDRHRRMLVSKFVEIHTFIAPHNEGNPIAECGATITTSMFPNGSLTITESEATGTSNSYTTAATAMPCKKYNLHKIGELLRKIPDGQISYTSEDQGSLSLDIASVAKSLVFKSPSKQFHGDDVGKYVKAQGKLFEANVKTDERISKVAILNPYRLGDFQKNIDSILEFDEQARYADTGGPVVYGLFKGKNRATYDYGLDYTVALPEGTIGMLVTVSQPSLASTIRIATTLNEGAQAGTGFTGLKNVNNTDRDGLILLSHLLCDYSGATHDNVDPDTNVLEALATVLSTFSFNNHLGSINAANGNVTVKHAGPTTIALANQAAYAYQKQIYLSYPGVTADNIFKDPSLLTKLSDAVKVMNAYTISTIGVTMTSWVKEDCFALGRIDMCDNDGDGYQITSGVDTVTFKIAQKSESDVSIPTKEGAAPLYLSQQKVLELWNLHAVKNQTVEDINALLKKFMADAIAVGGVTLSHQYMNLTIGDGSISMSGAKYGTFATIRAAAVSFSQAYDIAMHTSSGGGEEGEEPVPGYVKVELFEYPPGRPRYYDLERFLLNVQITSGMMETIGHAGIGNTLSTPTLYFGATDAKDCTLTGGTVKFMYEASKVKYWTGLVTSTITSETSDDRNAFLVCPVLVSEQAAYDLNTNATREEGNNDRKRLVTRVDALVTSEAMQVAAVANVSKYTNVDESGAVLFARPTKASYDISLEGTNIGVTVTPTEKNISTRKPILEAFYVAGEVFKAQVGDAPSNKQCSAFLFYLVKYHYAVLRLISAVPVLFSDDASSHVIYTYDNMYDCADAVGTGSLMLNVSKETGNTVSVLHTGKAEALSGINKVWCKSNKPPVDAEKMNKLQDSRLLYEYLNDYTSSATIKLTLPGVGHKPDPTKPFFTSYADIEFTLEGGGKYAPVVVLTKPYADSSAAFSFHRASLQGDTANLEAIAHVTLIDMIQQLVIGSSGSKRVEPELLGSTDTTGSGAVYQVNSQYTPPTSDVTGMTSFTLSLLAEPGDRAANGSVSTYYSESRIFQNGVAKDVFEVLGVTIPGNGIKAVDVFRKITEMTITDYSMRFLPVVRQEYMYSIPIYGTLKTVDVESGKKFELQHAVSDKAACFHGPDYHYIAQGLHEARIASSDNNAFSSKEWNYRFLIIALYIATSSHTTVAVTGDVSSNYGIDVDQTLGHTNNDAAFFASAFGKTAPPENPNNSAQTGWIVININSAGIKNFSVGPPAAVQEGDSSEIHRFEDTAVVYQGFNGVAMNDGKDLPSFAVESIVETFKKTDANAAVKANLVRGAYEGEPSAFEVSFTFVDGKMISSSGLNTAGSSANIIMKSCLSVCIALFLGVVAIM